jgi:hypothetical protein
MKALFSLFFMVGFIAIGTSQTDIPKTQPLKIGPKPNLDIKANPTNNGLRMPSVIDIGKTPNLKDSLMAPNIQMLPDRELRQAGYDMKIDPKVGEREKGNSKEHYGDMYLGDIKTTSLFVGIVCRDHEYVDGDRVKIYANGEVIDPNILLTASFKGVNLTLDKGFNRLDFEALNQGTSGPNTAQVDVYDDMGKLIYTNKWLLSTGSKASLIIVKE